MKLIKVELPRLAHWIDGFANRNGSPLSLTQSENQICLASLNGGQAILRLSANQPITDLAQLFSWLTRSRNFGVILLRRSGFSIAYGHTKGLTHEILASKTSSHYTQGRTAAGGWSQARYSRRRDNQVKHLITQASQQTLMFHNFNFSWLITGGDQQLLAKLLNQPNLSTLEVSEHTKILINDPKRNNIDEAIRQARTIYIEVTNAPQ